MGQERNSSPDSPPHRQAHAGAPMPAGNPRLDWLAFGVVALVIVLAWLPTLTSGSAVNPDEDFFLHASRYEAVRKSLLEHRAFPLRAHWFGGGFPTIGEPEDPALNPLVVLSLVFGSAMGIKLVAFISALVGGLGTYALTRYILDYTRWGALFSALIAGTSLYVPGLMRGGSLAEVYTAFLPLCVLLVALSCRGRSGALFLLPLILCTMLSDGKQTLFMTMFYVGVLCLLDVVPMLRTVSPETSAKRLDLRALIVVLLAMGVTLLIGMVRILPALEFISAKGGLTNMELDLQSDLEGAYGPGWRELCSLVGGTHGAESYVTIGWLPVVLFAIAACFFWKRALPWGIALVLFTWITLADKAPLDLFRLLQTLPVFGTIALPYKYFAFQIVLSIAVGAGQFFWLLPRLPYRWLEHLCAIVLILAGVGFLYPRIMELQRATYTLEIPREYFTQHEEFFNVQSSDLPRNRSQPPRAVTYLNLLQNIGTIDWHTALPIAENAIPRYFVDTANSFSPNSQYQGEVFFPDESRPSAVAGPDEQAPPGSVTSWSFGPNSIVADVIVDRPSVLVINQNYHPAWRTDQGDLFERDGLLALRLSEPGPHTIHLRYLPRTFLAGLIITILSLTAWPFACWKIGGRLLQ
jgi:hypothetical protein